MSEQIPLGFGDHRPALGREDFIVAPCNAAAVALIDHWPEWTEPLLILSGPEGAGKTHLAEVWRARSGAVSLTPESFIESLDERGLATLLAAPALLVDGLDADAPVGREGGAAREVALCRLLDLARARGLAIVLTARRAPAAWVTALPDLRTRLTGAPLVVLGPPDEILLTNLAVKLFADRQLSVPPEAVLELIALVERSSRAVAAAVDLIDRTSLARQQPALTPKFIRSVLAGREP